MPTIDWPHPNHGYWAFIACFFNFLSGVLTDIAIFFPGWFQGRNGTDSENYFGLPDFMSDTKLHVKCYVYHLGPGPEGIGHKCFRSDSTEQGDDGKEAGWPNAIYFTLGASNLLNTIAFLIQMVFWSQLKKKVSKPMAKAAMVTLIIGAYTKFSGCWCIVSKMPSINAAYMQHNRVSDVQMRTMPLGLYFLSFCLDILAVAALKVVLDEGVKGEPTHRERLEAIEDERSSIHAKIEKKRSSFHTDTSEEHKKILDNASLSETMSITASITGSVTSHRDSHRGSHRQSRKDSIASTASSINAEDA